MPMDIEEAEKAAAEDVVAQREEALAKQLAEMKKRKKRLVDPLQFEMSYPGGRPFWICPGIWVGNGTAI